MRKCDCSKIREKIIDSALNLIKENGVTHTSVSKITEKVGIGKGTFYHFFSSKEDLLYVLMEKQAEESSEDFIKRLNGRPKMTADEGKDYLRFIIERDYIIYGYMSKADMQKMKKMLDAEKYKNISIEEDPFSGMYAYLNHVEGVKDNIDVKVLARMIASTSFVLQHWEEYPHLVDLQDIYETLLKHIYDYVFE
jgi:AcrR family transcriptional regulator